jgi:hypothetical protein
MTGREAKEAVQRHHTFVRVAVFVLGMVTAVYSESSPQDIMLFPQNPTPTTSLVTLDMMGYDSAVGDSSDAMVSAEALQGLINRSSEEKIYLFRTNSDQIDQGIGLGNGPDWNAELDWLENTPELSSLPRKNLERYPEQDGGLRKLLEVYAPRTKGVVIWDDRLEGHVRMATAGAAVTIASQTESIPMSPQIYEKLAGWGIELPVLMDLRGHSFSRDHEVLNWLVDTYWASSNQNAKVVISIGRDGFPSKSEEGVWHSDVMMSDGPVDYAVAINGFAFNIDIADEQDSAALMRLMSKYKPGESGVFGWIPVHIGERADDDPATPDVKEGFDEIPPSFKETAYFVMGANTVNNLSVFSSFDTLEKYTPQPATASPVNNNDVFVAFFVSDGDSYAHLTRGHFSNFAKYDAPEKGQIPITWTISTYLAELAPPMFNYFATNLPEGSDFLFAYANKPVLDDWPNLDELALLQGKYADLSGVRHAWTIHSEAESQRPNLVDWTSIVRGYIDSREVARPSKLNAEVPVFGTWAFESSWDTEKIADGIRASVVASDGPQFMYVWLGPGNDDGHPDSRYKRAVDVKKNLEANARGRTYTFLNASDMAATYKAYLGAQ